LRMKQFNPIGSEWRSVFGGTGLPCVRIRYAIRTYADWQTCRAFKWGEDLVK
jgi:hypothetical protein